MAGFTFNKLHNRFCNGKHQTNTQESVLYRLPDEVLIKIIQWLPPFTTSVKDGRTKNVNMWTNLARVSRRLHSLLLDRSLPSEIIRFQFPLLCFLFGQDSPLDYSTMMVLARTDERLKTIVARLPDCSCEHAVQRRHVRYIGLLIALAIHARAARVTRRHSSWLEVVADTFDYLPAEVVLLVKYTILSFSPQPPFSRHQRRTGEWTLSCILSSCRCSHVDVGSTLPAQIYIDLATEAYFFDSLYWASLSLSEHDISKMNALDLNKTYAAGMALQHYYIHHRSDVYRVKLSRRMTHDLLHVSDYATTMIGVTWKALENQFPRWLPDRPKELNRLPTTLVLDKVNQAIRRQFHSHEYLTSLIHDLDLNELKATLSKGVEASRIARWPDSGLGFLEQLDAQRLGPSCSRPNLKLRRWRQGCVFTSVCVAGLICAPLVLAGLTYELCRLIRERRQQRRTPFSSMVLTLDGPVLRQS